MSASPVTAPRRRVLVISQEAVGAIMAGPAIRSWWLAHELAHRHHVVLLVPSPIADAHIPPGVRVVVRQSLSFRFIREFSSRFDVVVSRPLRLHVQRALAASGARLIHDMYVPSPVEQLAQLADERDASRSRRELSYTRTRLETIAALTLADAVLCASQRQRDLWIGALAAIGRLTIADYARDPQLASIVGIVPFGIDPDPPRHHESVLRGVVTGIDDDAFLLLWTGGIWNWFDPLTVIDAVAQLQPELPNLRLHFMGIRHPSPDVRMAMTSRAVELARNRAVLDTSVTFNEGWLPYADRAGALLEADVGIAAHFDSAETDYSFRTRLLDHLWAGLPTITTAGGSMSDAIGDAGAGIVVPPRDVNAWKQAIRELASSAQRRREMSRHARAAGARLTWPRVCEPLLALVDEVAARPARRRSADLGNLLPRYLWVQGRIQLSTYGLLGAARKIIAALAR